VLGWLAGWLGGGAPRKYARLAPFASSIPDMGWPFVINLSALLTKKRLAQEHRNGQLPRTTRKGSAARRRRRRRRTRSASWPCRYLHDDDCLPSATSSNVTKVKPVSENDPFIHLEATRANADVVASDESRPRSDLASRIVVVRLIALDAAALSVVSPLLLFSPAEAAHTGRRLRLVGSRSRTFSLNAFDEGNP